VWEERTQWPEQPARGSDLLCCPQCGMGGDRQDAGRHTHSPPTPTSAHSLVSLPPRLPTQVLSGALHGVRLWLTKRDPPAGHEDDAAAAGSRPGTATSQRPKTGAKPGHEEPAIPESELPEPVPYGFLPPDLLQGSTVIEFSVGGLSPLPPSLAAAYTAATEGKAGGKLTFSIGLALPAGPSVELAGGVLVEGSHVAFPSNTRRAFMSRDQVAALKDHLEDGQPLAVELARWVRVSAAEPAPAS
jgi:hypothetical protein